MKKKNKTATLILLYIFFNIKMSDARKQKFYFYEDPLMTMSCQNAAGLRSYGLRLRINLERYSPRTSRDLRP